MKRFLIPAIVLATFTAQPLPCTPFLPCHSEQSEESMRSEGPLDLTRTLRLDYIFSGDAKTQSITLAELHSIDGWAGRRVNMDKVPVKGNGQLIMTIGGEEVYKTSFSTLFQEWQSTEEATKVSKAFENVFLAPMPTEKARVTVRLFDFKDGHVSCEFTHEVDPKDILIKPVGMNPPPHEWIWEGGDSLGTDPNSDERIDVAIVAEGYTEAQMDIFMEDARKAMESLWAHEPYRQLKDRFNLVCVKVPSRDSGVSVPRKGIWKETAVGSHFDTFYSNRYLTTLHLFKLHDILAGIPYEHIVILANTSTYGGGGIYNSYTLTTAHHSDFKPVVVHEFGHSFAGLADEYYYDDQYSEYYYPEVEPWERNITTMKDFDSKWKDLMGKKFSSDDTHINWRSKKKVGKKTAVDLYEGGGYQSKGVWRGFPDCRMNTNSYPSFCPVCREAIRYMIDFNTKEVVD